MFHFLAPVDPHQTKPAVVSWQRKLQQAQSNLFCKELFTQLAHEAYNSGICSNSSVVIGDEIRSEIFPGTNLCITYSHHKEELEKAQLQDQTSEKVCTSEDCPLLKCPVFAMPSPLLLEERSKDRKRKDKFCLHRYFLILLSLCYF